MKSLPNYKSIRNRTYLFDMNHPLAAGRNFQLGKRGSISYFGWLSDKNFGDDILALVARAELSDYWLQSAYPWPKIEDRFLSAMPLAPKNVATLIGGGTIIGGNFSKTIMKPLFMSRPIFTFGSGALPLVNWTKENRSFWREILSRARLISVRGEASARVLHELTGRKDIEVTGDFALRASHHYPVFSESGKADKLRVGVNLGSHKLSGKPRTRESVVAAMAEFVRRFQLDFEFVPLFLHTIDEKATLSAFTTAGVSYKNPIALHKKTKNLSKLGCLDLVISERLHGSVLAHSYDVPAIGIGYDNKVSDHFDTMRQLDCVLPLEGISAQVLSQSVEGLVRSLPAFKERIGVRRRELSIKQEMYLQSIRAAI